MKVIFEVDFMKEASYVLKSLSLRRSLPHGALKCIDPSALAACILPFLPRSFEAC